MNNIISSMSVGLNLGLIYVLFEFLKDKMRIKNDLIRKNGECETLKKEVEEYKKGVEESITVGLNLPPMTSEEVQEFRRLWRKICITTPLNNRNSNELYDAFRERIKEKLNSGEVYMKGRPLTVEEAEILEYSMNRSFSDVPTSLDETTANEQQPHN